MLGLSISPVKPIRPPHAAWARVASAFVQTRWALAVRLFAEDHATVGDASDQTTSIRASAASSWRF